MPEWYRAAIANRPPSPVPINELPAFLRLGARGPCETAAQAAHAPTGSGGGGSSAEAALMAAELARVRVQLEQSEREKKLLEGSRLCGICMDQLRSTALLPCGHTLCAVCAAQQMAQSRRLCPECRAPIQLTTCIFGV